VALDNLSRASLNSTFDLTYRVVWPDGSEHILGARGRVLPDEKGQPLCMTGVSWDETARQRAAVELRQSETKFRTLFESSQDAVLIAQDGRFIECNRTAVKMFGCAGKEQLLHLPPEGISPPRQPCGAESSSLARLRMEEALRLGVCRFEWMHQRMDSGLPFPSEVILSRMDMGGVLLLQGTVRDISTRVQMQQRIAAHEQALQRLSAALFSAEHRERRNIAAGLHDEVCQSLVLARLKLKAVKQAGDTEAARVLAEEIDALIKSILGTCHTLIFRPGHPRAGPTGAAGRAGGIVRADPAGARPGLRAGMPGGISAKFRSRPAGSSSIQCANCCSTFANTRGPGVCASCCAPAPAASWPRWRTTELAAPRRRWRDSAPPAASASSRFANGSRTWEEDCL
jgi:PAS domain S-box-containing protein